MNLRAIAGAIARKVVARAPTAIRDLAGLCGLGFVAYGAHEIYHPVGWIVLGLELVAGVALTAAAKARGHHIPDAGNKVA